MNKDKQIGFNVSGQTLDLEERLRIANHPFCAMAVLAQLASDTNCDVRTAVAENQNTTASVLVLACLCV